MEPETLFINEWVARGDSLYTVLYGLSLSIIEEHIRMEFPVFIHSLYDDDFCMSGAGTNILPVITCIE